MTSSPAIDDEKSAGPIRNVSAVLEEATSLQAEDKDVAIAIVGEHSHEIDPAFEARVVRKIDLFLVPAMFVGYGLVYYDKVCLEFAIWEAYTNIIRQSWDLQCSLE